MSGTMTQPETIALHAGQEPDPTTGARAVPIYQTTSYVFKDSEHAANLFALKAFGNIYTRLMNPTSDVVEKRIAALEGGSGALLTSSGMSAIFLAIHTLAEAGDHIVSSTSLYGGTETCFRYTLPKMGIETTFVGDATAETIAAAIQPNTKAVYLETLGNPKGDVLDIAGIAAAAHDAGVAVVVDNTFAPILCKPIEHGADIVVHSCTKWIGGHGTSIGGVIVDSGKFDWSTGRYPGFTTPDPSYHGLVYWDALSDVPDMGNVAFIIKARVQLMRDLGATPAPMNSFLFNLGLETLHLRMPRHSENALALAKHLQQHPLVNWVTYPGLKDHPNYERTEKYLPKGASGVMTFGIKGGSDAGVKFMESLKLVALVVHVGDARSCVLHPASTTHRQLTEEQLISSGVAPDLIRLSIGIEHIDDIIDDVDQALDISQK